MAIGKLDCFFHPILSMILLELLDSQMVNLIVLNARTHNADKNVTRVCPTVRLIDLMFAAIHVSKTVVGSKESTREFTETLGQLKL